jgi:hypothetical protein
MPPGALATVPVPLPWSVTESDGGDGGGGGGGGGAAGAETTSPRASLPSPAPLVPPAKAITRELMIAPGCTDALTVTVTAYVGVDAPAPSALNSQSIVYGSGREHPDGGSPTVQFESRKRTSENGVCALVPEFVAENVIVADPPGGALVGEIDSPTAIETSRIAAGDAPTNSSSPAVSARTLNAIIGN